MPENQMASTCSCVWDNVPSWCLCKCPCDRSIFHTLFLIMTFCMLVPHGIAYSWCPCPWNSPIKPLGLDVKSKWPFMRMKFSLKSFQPTQQQTFYQQECKSKQTISSLFSRVHFAKRLQKKFPNKWNKNKYCTVFPSNAWLQAMCFAATRGSTKPFSPTMTKMLLSAVDIIPILHQVNYCPILAIKSCVYSLYSLLFVFQTQFVFSMKSKSQSMKARSSAEAALTVDNMMTSRCFWFTASFTEVFFFNHY